MPVNVLVRPSGRRFTAEPHESLLEAALRCGLSPRYSCSDGRCGKCTARLVHGRMGRSSFHDFPLSEAEHARGAFLMCRSHADGEDLEIEAAVAGGVDDIPLQQITTRVSRCEPLSADVMLLELKTARSRTLRFLAGQYVTLAMAGAPRRAKSLAGCPCNARRLRFHIRRSADDAFSRTVFRGLRVGDRVEVQGPYGAFTLDETSERPIVLFAYETGFAPIASLIEHALALELTQPITLYWASAGATGRYLDNYCRALSDSIDGFRYVPVALPSSQDRAAHFATAGDIIGAHPDVQEHDVYLCGPAPAMQPLTQRLSARGVPQQRLRIDAVRRFD